MCNYKKLISLAILNNIILFNIFSVSAMEKNKTLEQSTSSFSSTENEAKIDKKKSTELIQNSQVKVKKEIPEVSKLDVLLAEAEKEGFKVKIQALPRENLQVNTANASVPTKKHIKLDLATHKPTAQVPVTNRQHLHVPKITAPVVIPNRLLGIQKSTVFLPRRQLTVQKKSSVQLLLNRLNQIDRSIVNLELEKGVLLQQLKISLNSN